MNNMQQKGFVSIIVASILMILLSLVTIGFSQLMQREQRQSLDRQLSSQAYYAAETAVNDVYNELRSGSVSEKTSCNPNENIDRDDGIIDVNEPEVRYTCLLIDPTPESLVYDNGKISDQGAKVIPLNVPANFQSITLEWEGSEGEGDNIVSTSCPAYQALPASYPANSVPLLRIDLTPLYATNSRADLINRTETLFLNPVSNSCGVNTIVYSAQKGRFIDVQCDSSNQPYACSFTITGLANLPITPATGQMILRAKTVYANANLRITAVDDDLLNATELSGAQTVVDATGRANDVVRRIQVRLSNRETYAVPEFGLQAYDGICKQIQVAPPSTVGYPCYP
jgi:hypothetical protein